MSSTTGLQQSRRCTCDTANFPCPALFSVPDPTHYREYIYYHMTTPYQPSQEAQDFWRSAPDLIQFEGGVWERDYNITAQSAPDFGHAFFNPLDRNRSREYIVLRPYLPNERLRFFSYFLAFLLRIRVSSFKGAHWLLNVSVAVGRTAINAVKVLLRQRTLDNMNVR